MSLRFGFISIRSATSCPSPPSQSPYSYSCGTTGIYFFKKNTVESATLCFPPLVSFQHLQTHTFFPPSLAALFSLTRTKKESLDKKRVFLMQASWSLRSFLPSLVPPPTKKGQSQGGLGRGRTGGQPPTPICNAFFG